MFKKIILIILLCTAVFEISFAKSLFDGIELIKNLSNYKLKSNERYVVKRNDIYYERFTSKEYTGIGIYIEAGFVSKMKIKDGKLNGKSEFYNSKGQLFMTIKYKNSLMNGTMMTWANEITDKDKFILTSNIKYTNDKPCDGWIKHTGKVIAIPLFGDSLYTDILYKQCEKNGYELSKKKESYSFSYYRNNQLVNSLKVDKSNLSKKEIIKAMELVKVGKVKAFSFTKKTKYFPKTKTIKKNKKENWIKSNYTNPMTDAISQTLYTLSINKINYKNAQLYIRCSENKDKQVFINFNKSIVNYNEDSKGLQYRIDKGEAKYYSNTSLSTDKKALFINEFDKFTNELKNGSELIIRIESTYLKDTYDTLRFNITGLKKHLYDIEKNCIK